MIIRFKDPVPSVILLLHIIIIFLAMMFSTRAGIEALNPKGNPRKLVLWTVGLLIVGVTVLIPAWIVTILLLVVLIGFLLLPLVLVLTVALPAALVVMPLAGLVYGLYGAFEVYAGRDFRYWLVADWIEKRGVKSPSTELAVQPASQ